MMEINPADWAAIVQLSQFQAGLLARTSHELRSPLSSLMSLHQLILNDLCDSREEEQDCIRQAYESANRLLKMLELITYVSKLQVGLSSLEIDSISVNTLLEDVRFLTHTQAANRNINLLIEMPDQELENVSFQSDYRVLRQALVCLVESSMLSLSSGRVKLWCVDPSEANSLSINLATTPALSDWQNIDHFSLKNPEKVLEYLGISEPNLADPLTGDRSFFSLEYSLVISQLLLHRINGQLLVIKSDQADSPFYLQCRLGNLQ
jgi:hypothetical protein